jgi:hypothetical protein
MFGVPGCRLGSIRYADVHVVQPANTKPLLVIHGIKLGGDQLPAIGNERCAPPPLRLGLRRRDGGRVDHDTN